MSEMVATTIEGLDDLVARKFRPGQKVSLVLGLPRDLTAEEVAKFERSLAANGAKLLSPVEIGSTLEWTYALQVEIEAPNYDGVGALPLAVLLVLAAGAVGIASFLGFKVGNVIDQISNYIVPITLIGGGIFILYAYIQKRA